MTEETANFWSRSKFGCISLVLSLAEIGIIWSPLALVWTSGKHLTPLVVTVSSTTWLLGGLVSFGFAVAGLVTDSNRVAALIAVIVAVVTFLVCGLPMLV